MADCNIVSLTKVKTDIIETKDVEFEKVLDAILSNSKFIAFENDALTDSNKDRVYDLINDLVYDVIELHNTEVDDLAIDINYNPSTYVFDIVVNFIQPRLDLNNKLFDLAIEYSDNYEEKIIDYDIAVIILIDFNAVSKNENMHVITKYSDGRVVDHGKT
jgi:hypothetical protein